MDTHIQGRGSKVSLPWIGICPWMFDGKEHLRHKLWQSIKAIITAQLEVQVQTKSKSTRQARRQGIFQGLFLELEVYMTIAEQARSKLRLRSSIMGQRRALHTDCRLGSLWLPLAAKTTRQVWHGDALHFQ